MTAEELEALAGGENPASVGMDCEEVITYLARRVIAAEKLAVVIDCCFDFISESKDRPRTVEVLLNAIDEARDAYREASK